MRIIGLILCFMLASVAARAQCSSGNLSACPSPPFNTITANTLSVMGGGTPAVVQTNAALKALSITGLAANTAVLRSGFTSAGDGGAATYLLSTSACSLNSGAGDNGSQVAPNSGTGCWIANLAGTKPTPMLWGAVGNGSTDDTTALNAAFASGFPITVPDATFFSASGVTIPDNADVEGSTFLSGSALATGSTIECGLSVAECVTAGNDDNKPVTIKKLIISRASGTIPTSAAECLKVNGADGVTLEDVVCYRHAEGYHLVGAADRGTILMANRLYTCAITDSHIIIDGWALARFNQTLLGCNGAFDQAANSYVKITGGDGTVGPNTIDFVNSQFNLGQNTVTCAISFASLGTGQGSAIQDFEFTGATHIEGDQNLVCSDATATDIQRLVMQGVWANGGWGGGNHLFNLNAATTPNHWNFVGNKFDGWADITLAPTAQMNAVTFNSNTFLSPASITGASNSTVDFSNNTWDGLAVAGSFSQAFFTGPTTGGSYTNASASLVGSNLPMSQSWTPALTGSGGSGTPTYAVQYGEWWSDGARITAQFDIQITGTLSGFSGNMAIAGLPFTSVNVSNYQGSCSIDSFSGVTLTSGYTQASLAMADNATSIQLLETGSGEATAILQGSNLSGSGIIIAGTCTYRAR